MLTFQNFGLVILDKQPPGLRIALCLPHGVDDLVRRDPRALVHGAFVPEEEILGVGDTGGRHKDHAICTGREPHIAQPEGERLAVHTRVNEEKKRTSIDTSKRPTRDLPRGPQTSAVRRPRGLGRTYRRRLWHGVGMSRCG
jgi:hypothetical protein